MNPNDRIELLLGECAAATSRGDYGTATRKLKAAEKVSADDPRVLMAKAILSLQKGFPGAAVPILRRLDRAYPDNPNILDNLGVALSLSGDIDGGYEFVTRAAQLAPNDTTVQLDYAKLLVEKKQYLPALDIYRRVQPHMGNHPTFLNNYGWALRLSGDPAGATAILKGAAAAYPDDPLIVNNLGLSFEETGDYENAIACFRKCIQLVPQNAAYHGNLCGTLRQAGFFEEAVEAGREAVKLDPDDASLHLRFAVALFLTGRMEEGLHEYVHRTRLWAEQGLRPLVNRIWDGEPLSGETLLIRAEQGPGDQIVFSSFLDAVRERSPGSRIIVEIDRRLVPSFTRTYPEFEFIPFLRENDPDPYPPADVEIAFGDLPRHFCRSIEDIRPVRKLVADPALTAEWRQKFEALGPGTKVGVAWRGGVDPVTRIKRSLTLEDMFPILQTENCHFINLQYGNVRQEIEEFTARTGVKLHDWDGVDPLKDLETQIAQIEALDVVVQASNTSAHIAGALHKRTLMLQAFSPYWVWFLGIDFAPWYPTLRQFRVDASGGWPEVVDAVAQALRRISNEESHDQGIHRLRRARKGRLPCPRA